MAVDNIKLAFNHVVNVVIFNIYTINKFYSKDRLSETEWTLALLFMIKWLFYL